VKNLTLIIPAKREKESLPFVLDEIKNLDCNVSIVLDEKDHETISSIKDYKHKIIFQKGKGYGDALITGIKNTDTELFCIFNADGSFDPKELSGMIEKLNSENLDFLFASRYQSNSGSEDDNLITLVGNYIFTMLGKIFFRLKLTDILYTFVIGKTSSMKELDLNRKDFSFCVEFPIKAKRLNKKMASIGAYERPRIGGIKKVNAFKDGFLILMYMIIIFFRKD
jgi:glycosyltransferase involved in cell wall biosynthesis